MEGLGKGSDQVGTKAGGRGRLLEPPQEAEPRESVTEEARPGERPPLPVGPLGAAVGPLMDLLFDLGSRDEVARAVLQTEGLGDDEEVSGDVPEGSWGHLLVGTVDEVTTPFLGQGAVPLPCQRVSAHEELLEHSRTSTKGETGDRLDYTRGSYVTCKRQDVQESH